MEQFMVHHALSLAAAPSIAIVYGLLFYAAALTAVLTLVLAVRRGLTRAAGTTRPSWRLLLADDPWDLAFRAGLWLGLAAVAVRHLRYLLAPGWLGPLLDGLTLIQPVGLVGGGLLLLAALGLWLRRRLGGGRAGWRGTDGLALATLAAIVLTGLANRLVPADVTALKAFLLGLMRGELWPLPTDPLLLAHLWLAVLLLALLPFTSVFSLSAAPQADGPAAACPPCRLRRGASGVLALLLVTTALPSSMAVARQGVGEPPQDLARLVKSHQLVDPGPMIRYHGRLLIAERKTVIRQGLRPEDETIERCVTCHVVDPGGKAVAYDDDRHFCRGCHQTMVVGIDCFECHNARPIPDPREAREVVTRVVKATAEQPASQRSPAP